MTTPRHNGAELLILPRAGGREKVDRPVSAVVAGGGIAGIAAASVLAERGFSVTLCEKESFLGGRAGAWTDQLRDGTRFEMERGFHAFFRQYYNLRELLRRVDPELSMLKPLDDYPILGPDGLVESFAGLPRKSPWNVVALTKRTPTMGLRDLLKVNGRAAFEMLRYDSDRTYTQFDARSASDYLDSLAFPPSARRMLFDVFSHSFFNPEESMSAGELLMMFHFYFVGNPEGLIFDVARQPFSTAIFEPFRRYLESKGVEVRTGCAVERVDRGEDGFVTQTSSGAVESDLAVLALTVPALQRVVAASGTLTDESWRRSVDGLALTNPFAVWRLWLDKPAKPGRAGFVGTTGVGLLDNISLFELLEDESREWAERTGGSVVELHAYAVPEGISEDELRDDLMKGLHVFYPETRDARVVEERFLLRRDCPAFGLGSFGDRPGVTTPVDGLALAGDFVRLPMPSALMERAATSGMLAANHLMADYGVQPEPLWSIPRRGMFAGRRSKVSRRLAGAMR